MSTELVDLFKSIGLSDQKAAETAKNPTISSTLKLFIDQIKSCNNKEGVSKPIGTLLYLLSSSGLSQSWQNKIILDSIVSSKINSALQIKAAVEYVKAKTEQQVDFSEFESACGIGVKYSEEGITSEIKCILQSGPSKSTCNEGAVVGAVLKKLKWADVALVKQLVQNLMPRNTSYEKSVSECSEKKKVELNNKSKMHSTSKDQHFTSYAALAAHIDPKVIYSVGEAAKLHKPGENHKTDGYLVTDRNMEHLANFTREYGNQVRTRFPPEPNGILHIGHAKAINFNFGYAKANNGVCFLRYDDTNAEKEEEKFFTGIIEAVRWLGFEPYRVTYASDHFQWLYEQAVNLIKRGFAYVCHQPADELKGTSVPFSPWRDRPSSESLVLFNQMKQGMIDEGRATLRLKYVMEDGKKDPVIYRIKFVPHYRTGDEWCIYPTYDYTHPLCDSREAISHSLCTKEFQSHRSMYYWLCQAVDVYCPVQWEYGRLNVDYTVVSKRKIAKLIENKIVSDWDDPRLFTLSALKKRGVPPEAVNLFVSNVGVTMSSSSIHPDMLDHCIRDVLNVVAPRTMVVLEPLRVKIENVSSQTLIQVDDFPNDPSRGSHSISFSSDVFIECSDFLESSSLSDFRRLTMSQPVGLRHANVVIHVKEVVRKSDGVTIDYLLAKSEPMTSENKPRAVIHWVSDPVPCTIRLYDRLFLHQNPEDPRVVPDGFLSDINPNSLTVLNSGLADKSLLKMCETQKRFQFERVGYFFLDSTDALSSESAPKISFNRIVSLKDVPKLKQN